MSSLLALCVQIPQVYIGDLADPVWGNPCYQLYTKAYYEMVKSKLNPGGIMITQSGPAGVSSCTQVWTPINNTLRQVFPVVMPLAAHVAESGCGPSGAAS